MKKMLLGLSLAVTALGFLMSPAMAATNPPQGAPVLSVADQAFLASLAAPVPAAKRPHIGLKDTCIANCAGGGTVSCSGGGSCTAVDGNCGAGEPGHVTCAGTTTWCSPCPDCGPDWCTGEGDCAIQCTGCQYNYTCTDYPTCTDHCHCILRTCF